ncbi:MAG: hypothetical protein Salg2KO_11740 [Salibacteraceae bacterium]
MTRWVMYIGIWLSGFSVYSQSSYLPNQINLKIKEEFRELVSDHGILDERFESRVQGLQIGSLKRLFPNQEPIAQRSLEYSERKTDLSLIYRLEYKASIVPKIVSRMLMEAGLFEYVDPVFINSVVFTPSDSEIGQQWHHEAIRSFAAWDIDTGSADKVVAIIDTGCDWDHEDLSESIVLNESDPIDGIDNDGNGFVDDYRGWNFYDDNNDIDEISWSHGTHVAGLCAARANNAKGVAGTGFSNKILVVKAGNQLQLTHGYEGIEYAMEMGVDVINCSWGSVEYTALGEDVVNAATEVGIFIVAAAGNNNDENDFYPASFKSVMSVAATRQGDTKAESSSYNYNVDISAPGERIISTKNDNEYGEDSGTSMASPIVAGAAALLLSRYGNLKPRQIQAQLVETARNIDTLSGNEAFRKKLGAGILDMGRAVDSIVDIALGVENYSLTDNDDEVYAIGDEIQLGLEIENYLGNSGVTKVVVEPLDPYVTMLQDTKFFTPLVAGQRSNNYFSPFTMIVAENTPYNAQTHLKLTITNDSFDYKRIEYIPILLNPDFVNITVNDVHTSISSNGTIGYADFSRSNGLGFELVGEAAVLYESGLMIGIQNTQDRIRVMDRIRGEGATDRDFTALEVIEKEMPIGFEAYRATGQFSDSSGGSNQIGLWVSQKAAAYNDAGHDQYIVLEYDVINKSEKALENMYIGLFADWDIFSANENFGETIYGKRLGIVSSQGKNRVLAGIQQLNGGLPFHSYMINNRAETGDVIFSEGGYSTMEKYICLSQDLLVQGNEEEGVDVSNVVSTGYFTLAPGDTQRVAFALMAATSKESILATADSAFKRYNGYAPGERIFASIQNVQAFPNPTKGEVNLTFQLKHDEEIEIELYSSNGNLTYYQPVKTYYSGANIEKLQLPQFMPGSYYLRLRSERIDRVIPVQIIRD